MEGTTSAPIEALEVEFKVNVEKNVLAAQQYLIQSKLVSDDVWKVCTQYLREKEYQEIAQERAIMMRCGYVFCNNPIKSIRELIDENSMKLHPKTHSVAPPSERSIFDVPKEIPEEIYQISYKTGKIYDGKERFYYCCKDCFVKSQVLGRSLSSSAIYTRTFSHNSFTENMLALKKYQQNEMQLQVKTENKQFSKVTTNREFEMVKEDLIKKRVFEKVTVTEKVDVAPPSVKFDENKTLEKCNPMEEDYSSSSSEDENESMDNADGEGEEENPSNSLMDEKPLRPKMSSFFSPFTQAISIIQALSNTKSKNYLKTFDEGEKYQPNPETFVAIVPLSADYQRFTVFRSKIVPSAKTFYLQYGLDKIIMDRLETLLQSFLYLQAVDINAALIKILTFVFLYAVADNFNKALLDKNWSTTSRILRIECGLKDGQFKPLVWELNPSFK